MKYTCAICNFKSTHLDKFYGDEAFKVCDDCYRKLAKRMADEEALLYILFDIGEIKRGYHRPIDD